MIEISIDPLLKSKVPDLVLGCVSATVQVTQHDAQLWREVEARIQNLAAEMTVEQMTNLPQIQAQRRAYKAVGKDPSRYRGSAEALLRRAIQGKGLSPVNTLVDINNLLSLETLHPLGSYDCEKLNPPIRFGIGNIGESYQGISSRSINIAQLPVFIDQLGPFGSPTQDSDRAIVTPNSTSILLLIVSFSGTENINQALQRTQQLLEHYAAANKLTTAVVSCCG